MNTHIKFRTIAIAILLMASVSTMFGQEKIGQPQDLCRDNVHITVTNLGNLPPNGTITVNFYNPSPTVSCTRYESFSNGYQGLVLGERNNEVWSWVFIRVILGNNQYYADYFSTEQWRPVVFQGSDFRPIGPGGIPAYKLPAFPW